MFYLLAGWLLLNVAYVVGALIWGILRGQDPDLYEPWDPYR